MSEHLKRDRIIPQEMAREEGILDSYRYTQIAYRYEWGIWQAEKRERHDLIFFNDDWNRLVLAEGYCTVQGRGTAVYRTLALRKLDAQGLGQLIDTNEEVPKAVMRGLEKKFRNGAGSAQVRLDRLTRSHERVLITLGALGYYFNPNDDDDD